MSILSSSPSVRMPVKLSIETPKGRRRQVVVIVEKTAQDDDCALMSKASEAFRRRYGFADRVVAIYVTSCGGR